MKRENGFTLIELMIVIAIIAILAAVGYPAYTQQIQKAKRSAAQQFLMEVALAQDQYILDTMNYADSLGDDGDTEQDDLDLAVPTEVDANYAITITVSTAPETYTVTATPKAGSQMDGTDTMTLNSDGTKTPSELW